MQRVSSRQNERLRDVRRLIESSRDRRKSGRCVLEGAHLIDVYCSRIGVPELLIVVDDRLGDPSIASRATRMPPSQTMVIPRARFAELATLPADIGALAVVTAPRDFPATQGAFCLLLDGVQDPGNVGTIIRTAAAAGVDQVVLSRECAFAWAPKAMRAAQGGHFLTTLVEGVDLDAWTGAFQAAGGSLIATVVSDAASPWDADLRGRIAVVVGSEGTGVSRGLLDRADRRVSIPMADDSESLNAAAAAAVVLFECVRQRQRVADDRVARR